MARSGKLGKHVPWRRTVYVKAWATNEFADAPDYARFEANARFIRTLRRLQKLCRKHKLTSVRAGGHPGKWGPGDIEDELRLRGDVLVVTRSQFWFSAYPKYGDFYVETSSQDIDSFCRLVGSSNEPLFFDMDPADLEEEAESEPVETPP